MKVKCEREKLNVLVQTALRAISSRVTMPILSGVLLETKDGKLAASGTDLELSIKAVAEAEVLEEGSTVVSGRLLGEILKNLPEGELVISSGEKFLNVEAEAGTYSIREMLPEDFPPIPDWAGEATLRAPAREFQMAVQQTSRASSTDDKRPILTGTLLEKNIKEGKMRLVTTDSYRLAWKDFAVSGEVSVWEDSIIPTKSLVELSRIVSGFDGEIEMKIQERQAMFKVEDLILRSRLIEGQFPQYRQLIPKGEKTTITASKTDLIGSIKRALVFGHNLRLTISEETLTIRTETPDIGESSETLSVQVEGEGIEIGFNGLYLMDGISAVEGEEVEVRFDDSQKPVLITGLGKEGYTYILMPMRLK